MAGLQRRQREVGAGILGGVGRCPAGRKDAAGVASLVQQVLAGLEAAAALEEVGGVHLEERYPVGGLQGGREAGDRRPVVPWVQ